MLKEPRTSTSRGKGASSQDTEQYLRGLQDRNVLSVKMRTVDGRDYFEILKKCEYRGIKFRKGDYISRDALHHEWEWFRGRNIHKGAIDPRTGRHLFEKARPDRILRRQ